MHHGGVILGTVKRSEKSYIASDVAQQKREESLTSMIMRGNSITFNCYPLEDACRRISALGYNSVEMWKDHLTGCKTPELVRHFVDFARGLGLGLFGLNVVGARYFDPFSSEQGFETTLKGLEEDVDFAIALGVKDVLVWEGIRPSDTTFGGDQLLDTLVNLFREAIAYAAPRGVRFLAEPHPFTLGMDLEFIVKLCDRVDKDHFGITYDCCHFGVGKPETYIDAIRFLGNRVKHIHFSDSDKRTSELHFPPGRGSLDLEGVIEAFKEVDFRGTITLDLYGYPLPEEGSRVGIPRLREAIKELGLEGGGRE